MLYIFWLIYIYIYIEIKVKTNHTRNHLYKEISMNMKLNHGKRLVFTKSIKALSNLDWLRGWLSGEKHWKLWFNVLSWEQIIQIHVIVNWYLVPLYSYCNMSFTLRINVVINSDGIWLLTFNRKHANRRDQYFVELSVNSLIALSTGYEEPPLVYYTTADV